MSTKTKIQILNNHINKLLKFKENHAAIQYYNIYFHSTWFFDISFSLFIDIILPCLF